MAVRIVAVDPATNCGWADSFGPSGVWHLRIKRDESGGMRLIRMRSKLRDLAAAGPIDLLVFEAARNAGVKNQGALVVQSELQGVLKEFCEDNCIEYRGYSPGEIKKHATGKGNCSKDEMVNAAIEHFQKKIEDDNEADALWLLDLAKSEYDN